MLGRLVVVANDTCVSLTRLSTLQGGGCGARPRTPFA